MLSGFRRSGLDSGRVTLLDDSREPPASSGGAHCRLRKLVRDSKCLCDRSEGGENVPGMAGV